MSPELLFFWIWVGIGIGLAVLYMIVKNMGFKHPVYYQTGGWCGLCGKWLEDTRVDTRWPYTVCPDWETACFHDS